jgi:formylglycine-generating enzyme required for sulfatase activity
VIRGTSIFVAATLAASLAASVAAESGMVAAPAGFYAPFVKEKALGAGDEAATSARRVGAFRIDVEPVTNAQFLEFVNAH